jgi:hypothetical protein
LASAHRIGERVQRVADQSEYLFDARFFERAHQELSNCLGHFLLLKLSQQGLTFMSYPWIVHAVRMLFAEHEYTL